MSFLLVWAYRRSMRPSPWLAALLLILDVLAFNSLIAVYGAASNPFNAVLLIPVVMAFILLPPVYAVFILLVSVAAQTLQIWLLPVHHHDAEMVSHFYAMVLSFVITSAVIAGVIFYFRYQLTQREASIQQLRERQLRDEQLLAIGTAAAQLTHEVATPAQSLRFLLEEAAEQKPNPDWLAPIVHEFSRIETELENWRGVADAIREKRRSDYLISEIWQTLQHVISITRPEVEVKWLPYAYTGHELIEADPTLAPALSSIVTNACDAALESNTPVTVSLTLARGRVLMAVSNYNASLNEAQLAALGSRIIASDSGFGVGAVVSNATIEKFAGEVVWQREGQQVVTQVSLPIKSLPIKSQPNQD
ncbi:hypothetical protein CWE08_01075 [Aliidiomarina iranensis]|uniref:Sensor histidine kinase n=1 Tax=Aliidiomarina iranensis TaxID=1434071 RepID=A0A432W229_9GAMM|nr:hypothetical protein [Aliidiomarina iranensis]RUO23275.1 hypothetical protein CWE08_01075 [Aliidiomarina iranensis]